jgi:chromosome segregation protein
MSKNNTKNSQNSQISFKGMQILIEDLKKKRDDLNLKTKSFINELQELEIDINNNLNIAKEKYKKKRDYWNDKVKQLKDKKLEYKALLDKLIEEKKTIQKNSNNSESPISLKQVERKIDNLERRIETENLNITEENAIIDKIKELAQSKQKFLAEQQNSDFFKIERKVEIVKINLNKIYEQLNKWSDKSQENHAKMLELYKKVDELREKKSMMEEELIENKKAADRYHEQYLQVMNQRKKSSKGKRPYKQYKKPNVKAVQNKKKNEMMEKIKQDKLAEALEKQKAGKKLNLFEARLILEKSER